MLHVRQLPFPINLLSLARVEKATTEKFGACHFTDLGNGPFTEFVGKSEQLRGELGGGMMGSGDSPSHVRVAMGKALGIIGQLDPDARKSEVCPVS